MNRRELLRSQKADIFEFIVEVGLNPTDFKWEDIASVTLRNTEIERLIHIPTDSYFVFDFYGDDDGYSIFSPAKDRVRDQERTANWFNQLVPVGDWIHAVKREHETPDLWEAIREESVLITAPSFEENEPFSADEQNLIRDKLDEFGKYLMEVHSIGPEVKNRLDYLANASTRIGRKDWFLLLNGMLLNIVLQFALSSEVARELFRFAAQLLGQLLRGYLPLP